MRPLDFLDKESIKKKAPHFKAGDKVRVDALIKEGDKERVQAFEGTVIKIHRAGIRSTFTVRKVSYGVGVERIFPLYSPLVQSITLVMSGKVRRSRLYYLRKRSGRKARIFAVETGGLAEEASRATLPSTQPSAKAAAPLENETAEPLPIVSGARK